VLGWTTTQSEWDRAIRTALDSSYVIQEAVPIPKEPYPMLLDGIRRVDVSLDLDPYLFGGKVSGSLTRLSSAALLNVTAGAGSVVPTYIVEPRG